MIMIIHGHSFLECTQCRCVRVICVHFRSKTTISFGRVVSRYTRKNEAAKQYFFCANTEKEREEWVDAISNAK